MRILENEHKNEYSFHRKSGANPMKIITKYTEPSNFSLENRQQQLTLKQKCEPKNCKYRKWYYHKDNSLRFLCSEDNNWDCKDTHNVYPNSFGEGRCG